MNAFSIQGNQAKCKECYLSLTLRQGSIDSSLAATFATQPSVTLLRYTIGVLPINYISILSTAAHISKDFKNMPSILHFQRSKLVT